MDYKFLYHILFNAATDAIWAIDEADYSRARRLLVEAQQRAEDLYIGNAEDSPEQRNISPCAGYSFYAMKWRRDGTEAVPYNTNRGANGLLPNGNISSLATPSALRATVSLRLGHGAALTCHRHVIHYRAAASLP